MARLTYTQLDRLARDLYPERSGAAKIVVELDNRDEFPATFEPLNKEYRDDPIFFWKLQHEHHPNY